MSELLIKVYQILDDAHRAFNRYAAIHRLKGTDDGLQKALGNDALALATGNAMAMLMPSIQYPGYEIGEHWLQTAYERICAGEKEADVLRDYGYARADN